MKNGKKVNIRIPQVQDAQEIINVIATADKETLFLARNSGEFQTTLEKEKSLIEKVLKNPDMEWFVAEYDGRVVGQCSVGLVKSLQRYRHRAEVAFVLLDKYCNLGIGGKMMEMCLAWCVQNGVTQVELDVVSTNRRALTMYRNFGFEVVGTMPKALKYLDDTFADEYKMVKYL